VDAENCMRNDLDYDLYDLQQEKGFKMILDQMDSVIEAVIGIAIHWNDDV